MLNKKEEFVNCQLLRFIFAQNFTDSMVFLHPNRWYFLLSTILLLSGFEGIAQSRRTLEEQRTQTLKEVEETSRYLEETQQSRKESLEKLNLLNTQVRQFNRLISGINDEISHADSQINETSANIGQMNNKIETLKSEYAQLVYHAYKNQGKYNKLVYVLSAKDFNEAYRRMKYFQQYSEYRKKQVSEITTAQEELRKMIEQLTSQKVEKEKLLNEQRKEGKRLEAVKRDQDKEVNNLKSQERKLRKQLAEQKQKAQKLQNEIKKIIEAEAKKRKGTSINLYDKLTPEERIVSNKFKDNKGRLPWPTEKGIITGHFGIYQHPLLKDIKMDNPGIDITTTGRSNVRAVFDGEVTGVGMIGGITFVFIRHGNFITVYQNLTDVSVKKGDKVKLKDTIGKVYTEEGMKTAILHFEIWEDSKKLNPELWVNKQ